MDPNEALRLIRLTIKQMEVDEHPGIYKAHAQELAGYVSGLDEWLSRDGFLPADWVAEEDKPPVDEEGRCEHGYFLTGGAGTCPMPASEHRTRKEMAR